MHTEANQFVHRKSVYGQVGFGGERKRKALMKGEIKGIYFSYSKNGKNKNGT